MTARKPDEVPMLTADMASAMKFAANTQHDMLDIEIEALRAIATGDAATYNTHTHVAVKRGEIEVLREQRDELLAAAKAMLSAYGNCGSPHQQSAADACEAAIANAGAA